MIIYLDLDGVIINWAKGVCDWFGVQCKPEEITHWDAMYDITHTEVDEFWNKIKTPAFWEYLEFYPGAKKFIKKLKKYSDVILLTSPARGCAGFRQNWIQKYLPDFYNENKYIITPGKYHCAYNKTILIDDSDKNCSMFAQNGGHTVLYPQPWNSAGKKLMSKKLITNKVKNKNNVTLTAVKTLLDMDLDYEEIKTG